MLQHVSNKSPQICLIGQSSGSVTESLAPPSIVCQFILVKHGYSGARSPSHNLQKLIHINSLCASEAPRVEHGSVKLLDVFCLLDEVSLPRLIPPVRFHLQSLSVEQDEGFQLPGNVSPVVEAVLDDDPGSEALQRGVVNGLDDVPGQLLLIQEVAGGLLEGVGAVEVSPGGDQQVHDVRVTVGCSYVERTDRNTDRWKHVY